MISVIILASTSGIFILWILVQRSYIKLLEDHITELRAERDLLFKENIELNNEVLTPERRAPNRE